MQEARRTLLRRLARIGACAAAALLLPGRSLAAWNKAAFESRQLGDALRAIGVVAPSESADIIIDLPEVADNGAVVQISITSKVAGTESIALLVDNNPLPLNAIFHFSNGAEAYVSTRIKMAETSQVRAVVKAGNRFYIASKETRVIQGGCG